MQPEIDWPLTLAWWGVIAAGIAAVFSVLSYVIQRRQDRASVSSIPTTEEELTTLRFIETYGPLPKGVYSSGSSSIYGWRLRKIDRFIVNEQGNRWLLDTLESLRDRDLVVRTPDEMRLTAEGRAILRRDAGRSIKADLRLALFDNTSRKTETLSVGRKVK